MRVLVWTQYFWPENFHINQVVAELSSHGVDVTVLTGKPNYPEGEIFTGYSALGIQTEYFDGVEVIRLPLYPRGNKSPHKLFLNYLSFVFSGYLLGPWALRGRDFDIVFVYAPSPILQALPAIFVSWIKRASLVLWVQDIWPESLRATGYIKSKYALKVVGGIVRYIYRCSDSILIQSEGFRDSVLRFSNFGEKISFFPNSAIEPAERTLSSLCLDDMSGFFSVVFAGNIGVAQSCSTIVGAARLLKDYEGIRFFIVGSGSMGGSIAQEIRDHGLGNIELLGRVPIEEMPRVYAASSVLLLTLKDDPILSVTIPSKFQSYLSAGKPIIACCNGQVAQLLDESKAGLNCAADDPVQLAEAVLELFNADPERLKTMGRNGREYFLQNFKLSNNISGLIKRFGLLAEK